MKLMAMAVLCGVMVGCGGDDDGSGVDPDKPLSEATVEDAMALCEYLEALDDPGVDQRIECYVDAIIAEDQGEGECQAIADACLSEPIEEDPSECPEIDESDLDVLPSCADQVSFGEFEACLDALNGREVGVAADIDCDTDLEALFEENQDPPEECQSVQDDCPEFFFDS
jgi:hypothetical protein